MAEDNSLSPWLKGLSASLIVALVGAAFTLFSTTNKNADKIVSLEKRMDIFDTLGSRTASLSEVLIKKLEESFNRLEKDHKELEVKVERLGERQDNLHLFIRNNPRLSPPRGEVSPVFKERNDG